MPNNLNDILIPQFIKSFELSRFQTGLVQSAFYLGYFIISIIGGAIWTPLMGYISDLTHSMAYAMTVPVISYIYIVYYSFAGSKPSGPLYESDEHKAVASH